METTPIIVCCEACDGEGRVQSSWPSPWETICAYCDGTGSEEIEGQPIDLEDAEFLAGGIA
jgi:DnaJ-class molecular chaperone